MYTSHTDLLHVTSLHLKITHTERDVDVVWFGVKIKASIMKGLCKKGQLLNPETPKSLTQKATNQDEQMK